MGTNTEKEQIKTNRVWTYTGREHTQRWDTYGDEIHIKREHT